MDTNNGLSTGQAGPHGYLQTNQNPRLRALSPAAERTLDAVRKQLRGMGCPRFQLQLLPPRGVETHLRPMPVRRRQSPADIERLLPWLRARNAGGYDIYICPEQPEDDALASPVLLVDDLNRDSVKQMRADGWCFAALVETSPANYQAWVRLSDDLLLHDWAVEAAKLLAQRYGGDPNAAKARQLGRLAGFTNRKPKHRQPDGRQPFCSLRAAEAGVPEAAGELLSTAFQVMEWKERAAAAAVAPVFQPAAEAPAGDPIQEFHRARMAAHRRSGTTDNSALDFSATLSMISHGYQLTDIRNALLTSPNLVSRHSNPHRYVERTLDRALVTAGRRQEARPISPRDEEDLASAVLADGCRPHPAHDITRRDRCPTLPRTPSP